MRRLRIENCGRVPYGEMHERQLRRRDEVLAGTHDDTLFIVEHPAVLTLGNRKGRENLLASDEQLRQRGVEVFETERGGDITYHGPGQLVVYPILALQPGEQDIKGYVYALEEIMIRICRDFGIDTERVEGLRGLWVGNNNIGAVGVRLSRWVTMHGFALNIHTQLEDFDLIIPCGLQGRGVTSVMKENGSEVEADIATFDASVESLLRHVPDILKREIYIAS